MQMTIKVEASEIAQAINNLSAAVGQILAARAETRAEAGAGKACAQVKSEPAALAQAPAPIPVAEPAPPAAPESLAPAADAPAAMAYTADVAPTMGRLLTEKGPGVVKTLLAQFGVKKGGELAPDQLAPALAKAQEILNG